MKIELESKKVYVSDDGKEKSYRMEDILKYEKRQLKSIFERRTNIANISTSTTLYLFKKGDVKTFQEFHPEAYLDDISEDEEGYFVYVYDSTYDDIGDSYHLYHQTKVNDRHTKLFFDTTVVLINFNIQFFFLFLGYLIFPNRLIALPTTFLFV